MTKLDETRISEIILSGYHERLLDRVHSDVAVVGAGPAGLVATTFLAHQGVKVTVLEKRLAPGGGIWGGGMGMNVAVVQEDAVAMLSDLEIPVESKGAGLYAVDSIDLAAGLCWQARRAGVVLLNLTTVEDLCVHEGRVTGVVVNRTMISGALPVDPIVLAASAVVDGTGHEAVAIEALRKRHLLNNVSPTGNGFGEGPMDASAGEDFVVEHVQEVFPGLWMTGMSVAAALGGPRMGPIFGGMLLSGRRAAEMILSNMKQRATRERWLL